MEGCPDILHFSALDPSTAAKLKPWRQLTPTSCCHGDAAAGCIQCSQTPGAPQEELLVQKCFYEEGAGGGGDLQVSDDPREQGPAPQPRSSHLVLRASLPGDNSTPMPMHKTQNRQPCCCIRAAPASPGTPSTSHALSLLSAPHLTVEGPRFRG